jgi:hypothetical protein
VLQSGGTYACTELRHSLGRIMTDPDAAATAVKVLQSGIIPATSAKIFAKSGFHGPRKAPESQLLST